MISIIVPSRNEKYLANTVNDLLQKAEGNIEIIVVLDGYWPAQMPIEDDRVIIIHRGMVHGMRHAINSAVAISKGDWILKCDAHCMFAQGYDIVLQDNMYSDNIVAVPRRKRLDAEKWMLIEDGRPDVDHMYLSNPDIPDIYGRDPGFHGIRWDERSALRLDTELDEIMMAQGSAWFMSKEYYKYLELMDEPNYGQFRSEFLEIGLKCWLSGGSVVCNKKTWYAHYHKDKRHRGYSLEKATAEELAFPLKWRIMGAAWHKQTLPLEWLIDKFKPVPGWVA
jgi:glycosyltransferase involved in cell wall biosynthesis